VAEYDDQFVSAQLAVPFGDTVINKLSVWSGECGNRRPNEALQWETIQWAKRQGFRYYDFEGIKPSVIEAIQNNDPLPASLKQSVTSYKLGFGGQATLFSEANVYLYNPIYRWAYREIFPKMQDLKVLKKMRKSLRTD
jgi:lipid II:glycine glycyltransferase (peptidoglycan interpeptide bridge formation enzyme)